MNDHQCHDDFGFPLMNFPSPDQTITHVTLWDTVWPLLEGTQYLLRALGVALVTEDLTGKQANTAIALLEGHVATALHILNRWSDANHQRAGSDEDATDVDSQPEEDTADGQC